MGKTKTSVTKLCAINGDPNVVPLDHKQSFIDDNQLLIVLTQLHLDKVDGSVPLVDADLMVVDTDTMKSTMLQRGHRWGMYGGFRGVPGLVPNGRRKKFFLIGNNIVSDLAYDYRSHESFRRLKNQIIIGASDDKKNLLVIDTQDDAIKFLDIETLKDEESTQIPVSLYEDPLGYYEDLMKSDVPGYFLAHHARNKLLAYRQDRESIRLIKNYSSEEQSDLSVQLSKDTLTSIDFNHKGDLLLCCSYKGTFYLWSTDTGQLIFTSNLQDADKICNTLKFINNSLAINGGNSSACIKFDIKNNKMRPREHNHHHCQLESTNKKGLVVRHRPVKDLQIEKYKPYKPKGIES